MSLVQRFVRGDPNLTHGKSDRIPAYKMMKISEVLLIAAISVANTEATARGRVPLTSPAKTYFPSSSKVSFGSFQTFGAAFATPSSVLVASASPPTIQSFSQAGASFAETGGSFAQTGGSFSRTSGSFAQTGGGFSGTNERFTQSRENFPERGSSFSQTSENVPPTGEDFLRINQKARPSQSFTQINAISPLADRTQGVGATAPFSFGTPTSSLEDLLEQEWNTFKTTFNKTYTSFEEERQRREIFIENRNKVARFNQEYGNGRHSFVQKLNQYADLLNHEFSRLVNGLNRTRGDNSQPAPEVKPSAFIPAANVGIPSYVDWRAAGAVTPVKRQGTCGACYAFAATGALEGQTFRKTGRLVDLSAQNLIDCTGTYSNSGCVGGLMEYAFEYVRDNRGIATENAYPFEERDGQQCRYRQDAYGAHDTGYVLLDEGDERALEVAVATVGPVAIGIDAHPESFQFYSNGVYFEPQCSGSSDQLNHAVLVVGYGTEPNGQQYWLLKNSYGPEWGIGGYMKMAKFSNNQCGVASYASYPLV